MCGIAGLFDPRHRLDADRRRAVAVAMHEAIAHRGPDDAGVWIDERAPLALAHRRLAIIDLSPEGHQPMISASGRYVIVFNGEVYNFQDLRQILDAKGARFRGHSDTEIMLAAFDAWGVEGATPRFNGMFAFAVWDRETQTVHFVRDRFGKKPLYVGWAGEGLVFASELKALWRHPGFAPSVSRDALRTYAQYGYVCAPYSIYEGVYQLLPGARLTLPLAAMTPGDDLASQMTLYWDQRAAAEEGRRNRLDMSQTQIVDEFEARLTRAVSERMMSDVPLGAFLSGGIDSSAVVALMQKSASRPVKTFCIGFDDERFNEARHAREIAEHLGTDHTEFTVSGREALDVVPTLADLYDEPLADASQIPTYLVCKLARSEVTVVLTGDGGDELLGGYERHYVVPAILSRLQRAPRSLRRLGAAALQRAPYRSLHRVAPGAARLWRRVKRTGDLLSLEVDDAPSIYRTLIRHWSDVDSLVIGGADTRIPMSDPARAPSGLNLSENVIYFDALSYRPNDLMVKIDRAGMAVALEARAPLMDYELYEFCARAPYEMSVRGGVGKWMLRQVLSRHVPEAMWNRPKMGFSVPLNDWLRGDLREWAGDLLNEDALKRQGYFHSDTVSRAWSDHQDGVNIRPTASHLWTVLMFQLWLERWGEAGRAAKAEPAPPAARVG